MKLDAGKYVPLANILFTERSNVNIVHLDVIFTDIAALDRIVQCGTAALDLQRQATALKAI